MSKRYSRPEESGWERGDFHSHISTSSIAHVDAVLSVLRFWFFLFIITGIVSAFCKRTEQLLQLPYSVSTAVLVLAGLLLLVMLWNDDGLDGLPKTMLSSSQKKAE